MMRTLLLLASHLVALGAGFAAGVYLLPILVAPPAPGVEQVRSASAGAMYKARFVRDLPGSDFLHWGEGTVSVGPKQVAFEGRLAPGPDYKLYPAPGVVRDEAEFERVKARAVRLGDVRTFENFVVAVPDGVDVSTYETVLVWCESFAEFITSAKYR